MPPKPGVYIFKNAKERVLYVGKAKDLRNRLRSYSQKSSKLNPRKTAMMRDVRNFTYVVTDNLTGLMWAKNANLPNGGKNWTEALDYVASMNSGAGLCGYHDWRLPNRKELHSLIDYSKYNPALPEGHPFTNVQSSQFSGNYYWSSTTNASSTDNAWYVYMWSGYVGGYDKSDKYCVWPVRAGQ